MSIPFTELRVQASDEQKILPGNKEESSAVEIDEVEGEESEAGTGGSSTGEEDENDSSSLEAAKTEAENLAFQPIDSRALSSSPLIRARVIKLLKHSKNNMHAYRNILIAIGCLSPSRQDRRFFIVRIRKGIRDGLWEKVCVPGDYAIDRSTGAKKRKPAVMCLRLLSETANKTAESMAQAAKDAEQGIVGEEELGTSKGM